MSEPCTTCFDCHDTVISASAVTRGQALQRFIALQGDGYAPAMCAGHGGAYTVCFNAAQRLPVGRQVHEFGQPAVDRRP